MLFSPGLRGRGGLLWGILDGHATRGQRGHMAGASYSVGFVQDRFVVSDFGENQLYNKHPPLMMQMLQNADM